MADSTESHGKPVEYSDREIRGEHLLRRSDASHAIVVLARARALHTIQALTLQKQTRDGLQRV